MREHIPDRVREYVLERDEYTCRYCGRTESPFHLDHVYPVSKGGETTANNLVTACEVCNYKKKNHVGIWPKPIGYFKREKFRRFWIFWSNVVLGILLTIFGLLLSSETNYNVRNVGSIVYALCWIPFLVSLAENGWYSTLELWRSLNNEY